MLITYNQQMQMLGNNAAPIEVASADALNDPGGDLVRALLCRAFSRVGSPQPEQEAEQLRCKLADDLQIYSVAQVMRPIHEPPESTRVSEMRRLISENLFEALQVEVVALTKSATPHLPPMMKPRRVRLGPERVGPSIR